MHAHSIDDWRHEHVFLDADHARSERRSWAVVILCGTMMAAEIGGGWLTGSMALVADGLHMSTHAGALVIAACAYAFARRYARDERFAFGTGKFGELAAFSSAIVLALIGLGIGVESALRLARPVPIAFREAVPIAALGLLVNLASAWLLREDHGPDDHHHGHGHEHRHDLHHHHADLNLRAAYVHVLADAAVSVLALVGLGAGLLFGLTWMDPAMGIVGALIIASWAWGLLRAAGAVLLDMRPGGGLAQEIRRRLEDGDDRIADLHLWRVGPGHHATLVSLVSDRPEPPQAYKARLAGLSGLSHVTVEVHPCPGAHD